MSLDDDWDSLKKVVANVTRRTNLMRAQRESIKEIPKINDVSSSMRPLDIGHIPLAKAAADISVDVGPHPSGDGRKQAVVKDATRQRAWSGEGKNESEATTEATRKFLSSRHASEYMKRQGE